MKKIWHYVKEAFVSIGKAVSLCFWFTLLLIASVLGGLHDLWEDMTDWLERISL